MTSMRLPIWAVRCRSWEGSMRRCSIMTRCWQRPDHVEALNNRGFALSRLKRFDEALLSLDRAMALRPAMREALNNRGNVLVALNRHDDAIADFNRALAICPDDFFAFNNRAIALQGLHRCGEALADFDRALTMRSDHPEVRFNRSLLMLTRGEFRE